MMRDMTNATTIESEEKFKDTPRRLDPGLARARETAEEVRWMHSKNNEEPIRRID
jgi:hypothetical protein